MKYTTDHDGKSKTASGVDAEHYPEQNEVENTDFEQIDSVPTHEEIARRAFELWKRRGCPEGSSNEDWCEAEEELRAATESRNTVNCTARRCGSVQR